jgi:hypothetical protein
MARLQECHPVFRTQLRRVLHDLEQEGDRPRIQDAYRSPQAQQRAAASGHSLLRWGFHNATAPDGTPEALAADVLDDDAPLAPSRRYLLALASAADRYGLETGITWGLGTPLRRAVLAAIAARDYDAPIKLGWDPCHVQVRGISVAQARRGARPDGGQYA